jgi:murein L,D-transpeptidase YafK
MAPLDQQADTVLVEKSARRLTLLRNGTSVATYDIAFGAAADEGHKAREGDERTPEGRYIIDWRNAGSIAHLSLHISYPNAADTTHAAAQGWSPGGNIMIHGLPNGWGFLGALHLMRDWTDGCIAVTNDEMKEIWSRVPDGTPIEIRP